MDVLSELQRRLVTLIVAVTPEDFEVVFNYIGNTDDFECQKLFDVTQAQREIDLGVCFDWFDDDIEIAQGSCFC